MFENNGAELSDCNRFRYKLWRIWDASKPLVMFMMMNPSTADSLQDDPTIRRCRNFAIDWGYGGFYVGNLYPYRSSNPKDLKTAPQIDSALIRNKSAIKEMADKCDKIVCAWGNAQAWPKDLLADFDNLYYIKLSSKGVPVHPLFLKKDLTLKKIRFDKGSAL